MEGLIAQTLHAFTRHDGTLQISWAGLAEVYKVAGGKRRLRLPAATTWDDRMPWDIVTARLRCLFPGLDCDRVQTFLTNAAVVDLSHEDGLEDDPQDCEARCNQLQAENDTLRRQKKALERRCRRYRKMWADAIAQQKDSA